MNFVRNGRVMSIPSAKYREWHRDASKQLIGGRCMTGITEVQIEIFSPDRRKSDLTNKAESVMDLLVDNGTIPDDNWFEIPKVNLKFGGVDKENPRAIITIYGSEKI